jgi:hypothetical protein
MYFARLTAVRNDGDWEAWVRFFLRGVYETSESATARDILALREAHRERIGREYTGSATGATATGPISTSLRDRWSRGLSVPGKGLFPPRKAQRHSGTEHISSSTADMFTYISV